MAFIKSGNKFYSFADYNDVEARDSRLFDANEGLTQTDVEDLLVRSTQRILDMFRASAWWKSYCVQTGNIAELIVKQSVLAPALNPFLIISRQNDFTDMCVYHALSEYLLPRVADFGNNDSAERQKMDFYDTKFRQLFAELQEAGDWYDLNADGNISDVEKQPRAVNLRRVR